MSDIFTLNFYSEQIRFLTFQMSLVVRHHPAMLNVSHTHTHTHTHTRLTALCPGLPRVSRYQKGKTNLDFTGARDSEWQWHQLGMCKSAPRSRQITTPAPHHWVFYRPDALPAAQPTASKHWRHKVKCFSEFIIHNIETVWEELKCLPFLNGGF